MAQELVRVSNRGYGENQNIGVGTDVTLLHRQQIHTNFLYPQLDTTIFGRQNFYKVSNYSSFSSNVLVVSPGVRYYFKPILESVVLLMPIVDIGVNWALFENYINSKLKAEKIITLKKLPNLVFTSARFSMFILDVITYYNYFPNQYLSFNREQTFQSL